MKAITFTKKNKPPLCDDTLGDLKSEGLSSDYISFAKSYRYDFLDQISQHLQCRKGYFVDWRFVDVLLLYNPKFISKYEVNYAEGEKLVMNLCLIGDNNIPEGGIYIDTSEDKKGKIYSFLNEPNMAGTDEKITIAESFDEFLGMIRLYEDSKMDDYGSYTLTRLQELDLILADNRNEYLFPWEV